MIDVSLHLNIVNQDGIFLNYKQTQHNGWLKLTVTGQLFRYHNITISGCWPKLQIYDSLHDISIV